MCYLSFQSLLSNPSYIKFANFIFTSLMLHFVNLTKRFSLSVAKFICFGFFPTVTFRISDFCILIKCTTSLMFEYVQSSHILFSPLVYGFVCLPASTSRL